MSYPGPNRIQVAKSLSENVTAITTPAFFVGDFQQLTISVSTSSTHATNVQMSNADGLQAAIPENSWANVLTPSVNSTFVLPIGYRWSRTSSPASSNATLIYSGRA
jgi:hypothetical protein